MRITNEMVLHWFSFYHIIFLLILNFDCCIWNISLVFRIPWQLLIGMKMLPFTSEIQFGKNTNIGGSSTDVHLNMTVRRRHTHTHTQTYEYLYRTDQYKRLKRMQ